METETDLETIKLTLKRGPIDNRSRELIIDPKFISFKAGIPSSLHQKIDKSSIKAYRFGVEWISGYRFTIGREYRIFVLDNENRILKIHFKSFYGIRKTECYHLYSEIVGNLWKYYFRDIANDFMHDFRSGREFSIGEVIFGRAGLKIKKEGVFTSDFLEISWDNVRTKDYRTYFVIYSEDNAAKNNKSFSYLNDWNTVMLHMVTVTILKNRNQNNPQLKTD